MEIKELEKINERHNKLHSYILSEIEFYERLQREPCKDERGEIFVRFMLDYLNKIEDKCGVDPIDELLNFKV